MEDKEKEIQEEETTPAPEEVTEEEATEEPEVEVEETEEPESEEEPTDIDHKKELEKLNEKEPQTKSELEKAERSLHFNAERLKELGGDPADVLKLKPEEPQEAQDDPRLIVKQELAKDRLRSMCSSDDEYRHAEWYVDNKGLSVDEAYLLANRGKIERSVTEAKRANVAFSRGSSGGEKKPQTSVPEMPQDQQQILQRRGYSYNPKTKTWQAKYYEEYYDHTTKSWQSRKLQR